MGRMRDALRTGPLPAQPVGQILMLHGGAERGHRQVNGRSLALQRTRAMAVSITPRLSEAGVLVSVLRFSINGWNARDPVPMAVTDTHEAVARLADAHPTLPIVLVGHSMGARAAAHAADGENVVGVLGLAPWLPPDDPIEPLAGRHLVAAHGRRDHITNPRQTRKFLTRADSVAASTRFVDMGAVGHYMLTGVGRWNDVVVNETLGIFDVGRVTSAD